MLLDTHRNGSHLPHLPFTHCVFIHYGGLGSDKTLCEALTVADAILFHVADPRADQNLSRHGSVRPFLRRGSNRVWGRSFGVLDPAYG